MKTRIFPIIILLIFSLCLVANDAVLAAQGVPGGGGGGGGGNAGQAAGALYGDLYVIERDGAGVPVTRQIDYTEAETGKTVTVYCQQPISAEGCTATPTALSQPIHLIKGPITALSTSCALLPLNGEQTDFDPALEDPCGVPTEYTTCLQEVKFGRESVARAPAQVIDMSYGEALGRINSAAANQCPCDYDTSYCDTGTSTDTRAIRRNPAGLLELCAPKEDGSGYAWATMDAPLENLGLYRGVMTNGCLGSVTDEKTGEEGVRVTVTTALDPTGIYYLNTSGFGYLVCAYGTAVPQTEAEALSQEQACQVTPDVVGGTADTPCWWESPTTPSTVTRQDMLTAAAFLAAGADKTSPITLDEVINVNTYLGINTWTYTRSKKTQVLTVTYFPFTVSGGPGGWFSYIRGADACTLDTQAYILRAGTAPSFTAGYISLFADLTNGVKLENVAVCRNGSALSFFCTDTLNAPYSSDNIMGCGGANWFTQTAEDARKVIWYLHNWAVPQIAY